MNRPVIGITSEALNLGLKFRASYKVNLLNVDYKNLVEKRGAVPIILPITTDFSLVERYVSLCDGFLFTGGADINPLTYGVVADKSLGMTDLDRDRFEIELMIAAIRANKPVLGICRGMQILNIALGGSLIQNIPDVKGSFNHMVSGNKYDVSHKVILEADNILYNIFGEELYVNSSHHQGIDRLGEGLQIIGVAEDGIVEAVKLKNHDFVYGLQWHPEELVYRDERMYEVVDLFLEKSARI